MGSVLTKNLTGIYVSLSYSSLENDMKYELLEKVTEYKIECVKNLALFKQ